jgi:hypothetical protein
MFRKCAETWRSYEFILLSTLIGRYTDWKNMHSMNNTKFAYGGVKGMVPLILNLVIRLKFGVSLMSPGFTPKESVPGIHRRESWVLQC